MSLITKGDFTEYGNNEPIELGILGSDTQFTTVDGFDTKGALELTVQITNGVINSSDGSISQGDSTNLSVIFYADLGLGYTTIPIGALNLGTNSSDIWFGITGHYQLKILINNADQTNSTKVNYKVVVKK